MRKETNEVAIGAEIYVSEFLRPGQNLLDQPPYFWALDDIGFPDHYFKKPQEGESAIFATIARQYEQAARDTDTPCYYLPNNYSAKFRNLVRSGYRTNIPAILQRLTDYLNREYPGSIEYLAYYWILENMGWFNRLGNPTRYCPHDVSTYAAWAYAQKSSTYRYILMGLDEIFPGDREMPANVLSKLTTQSPQNRWFRVVRKSGALE